MGKKCVTEIEVMRRRVERVAVQLAEKDPDAFERWLKEAETLLARSERSRRS